MATLATLRDRVRRLVGGPDTTEMPDATIESFLDTDALRWLNHQDPNAVLTSFTTVADQQYYDVKPSGAYDITEVYWDACNYINLGGNLRFYPEGYEMNRQLAGFDALGNPGLVQTFFKQVEAYRESFGGIGYEMPDGQVGLFPCPGSSGDTVYFWYTVARYSAVTAIADGSEHQEGLVKKAAQMVLEQLAIKRGRIRAGRSFTGGGGANERAQAEQYRDEAEDCVPASMVGTINRG